MEVNEALSIQQRIKRANIAHRNANKLKVARDRSARKLAPESNIKSRAYAVARKILRKRIAGGRGAVYQELGPTEKISIDKQLDKKKALIKKIALRLIPRIRQSEQHRLQSFLKGKAMKNDINEAFEKKFKKTKKKPDSYIKFFNKFTEEKQNNTGAYKSLLKKSEKHGVDVEAIGDIYNEAFNDFDNVETNLTPEQYAFSRVNHELNELSKDTLRSYTAKSFAKLVGAEDKQKETLYRQHRFRSKGMHKKAEAENQNIKSTRKVMDKRFKGIQRADARLKEDLDESNNTPYVKKHIENGEHKGWKASNKHGKVKYFGLPFESSANKHAGLNEQTAYSQSELGKHVKTYKNVRGSKYDLYKNLNGHKLVNRISGASEDYPHQNTRELHKKLLKTLLPEETQLDEVSPSRTAADVKGAQHNLANLKRGIKPEIKKAPTWKQHMASYDKDEKEQIAHHRKHYEYHKAELKDLHKTYKDLHSGNLGISKNDKEAQHGAEEEIESMKDKHRAKIEHHLNKMHYHNNNLSKPGKIKESLDEDLNELSMRTMGSYNEKARDQLKAHSAAAADRLANKVRDPKAAKAGAATTLKRYQGLNRLRRKFSEETSIDEGRFRKARDPWSPDVPVPDAAYSAKTGQIKKRSPAYKQHIKDHYHKSLWAQHGVKEDLDEARYIVSGRHQDQGFSKTKVYKADSEDHARKQFHDEFDNFHAHKIKKLSLSKLKNEETLDELSNPTLLSYIDKSRKSTPIYPKKNDVKSIQRNAITKKAINKVSDRYKNEEHDKCGTPECCGQCEPLDEFVLTAATIAAIAAAKKTKKVAPKVGNYVKKQAFNQVGHLKDKVASIISKKEKPETRMSSKQYLKKREDMMKEDVDLTDRIENLVELSREKLSAYENKRRDQAHKTPESNPKRDELFSKASKARNKIIVKDTTSPAYKKHTQAIDNLKRHGNIEMTLHHNKVPNHLHDLYAHAIRHGVRSKGFIDGVRDLKEEVELTERNKENKFKKDLYVAKRGQKASRIWGLNKSDTADRAGHDHHIDYGDNDDHEDDASARHGMRKTAVRIYKKLGRRGLKEDSVNEVLGPENQIGTKALVKKLQKATPGQEKAQVNEQFEKELIHHGVILHRTNKERKTKAGGYTSDHKVIKWSKQYDINPNLKSFSGKGAGHAHQFAHQKAVRDHPEVKKHLKDGWSVDTFKIDPSKKPVLDHINNKLAYIKKQNGNLHLTEDLDLGEACWKGYNQLGMKKKGDKTVPNCVKESDEQNFRKQHNLEKAKKSVRPNVWGSHVGYIGKKRYTTFPDNVAAKQWLGEDVKSAELKGVIVPAYVDADGNTIPAKTIKRKEGNKILKTGNMQDGK